jgi:hypothetical protein
VSKPSTSRRKRRYESQSLLRRAGRSGRGADGPFGRDGAGTGRPAAFASSIQAVIASLTEASAPWAVVADADAPGKLRDAGNEAGAVFLRLDGHGIGEVWPFGCSHWTTFRRWRIYVEARLETERPAQTDRRRTDGRQCFGISRSPFAGMEEPPCCRSLKSLERVKGIEPSSSAWKAVGLFNKNNAS